MDTPPQSQVPFVAVYWDFENVHASIHELEVGPYRGEGAFRPQDPLINVSAVMDYASSLGEVCVNRAYGNWGFFHRYRDLLMNHAVELIQLFPRGMNGKNGADIQLCVDLMEDLTRRPHIGIYIIVSGDSDFIGVGQKIRQHGKRVIGVGVKEMTNRYWVQSCNEFKFYDVLLSTDAAVPPNGTATGNLDALPSALMLLTSVLERLAGQTGEEWVTKAAVKPMMLRINPAFDERNYGFSNFAAFIEAAHDVIEEKAGAHDHLLRLKKRLGEPDRKELLKSARKLVVAAMSFLSKIRPEVPLGALKPMMQKLQPDFSERAYGSTTFSQFVRSFPDTIAIENREGGLPYAKLLVPCDEGGYTAPPVKTPAPPSLTAVPEESLSAATAFHWNSLRTNAAVDWPNYHARLQNALEAAQAPADPGTLQAIQSIMWNSKSFQMLPNRSGITLRSEFLSQEALDSHLRTCFEQQRQSGTQVGPGTASIEN